MKAIFRVIILLTLKQIALAQNEDEIWGIGTKWTYKFNWAWDSNDTLNFAIIELYTKSV